ncbi:MAG TPA: lactate racemase domain-containing protein, partial [Candidatus Hypogeohydataceae bacterium YC40]
IVTSPFGFPVYIDKYASEADHIVVVNRIKPHTRFSGKIESGIVKMLLVGLGKHMGASLYHKALMEYPFDEMAFTIVPVLLQRLSILYGLAIIENSDGETVELKALLAGEFLEEETKLLQRAYELMVKLPLNAIDLLIVDEMGKDISGTGMDTTIIGRKDNSSIKIKRIFVRDLTERSNGNACGIGLADFTTRRLVDKIKLKDTYVNCITGLRPEGAKIPIAFDTDREAIEQALNTIGLVEPQEAKIVRIKNTSKLETLLVSEPCMPQLQDKKDLDIMSEPEEWVFDQSGNLLPLNS